MSRRTFVISLVVAIPLVATTAWLLWRVGLLDAPPHYVRHFEDVIEEVPAVVDGPWEDGPADKVIGLVGQTLEEVQKQLGLPNQEYEFSMGRGMDEFRCELMNTYPPGSLRSLGVRIRE